MRREEESGCRRYLGGLEGDASRVKRDALSYKAEGLCVLVGGSFIMALRELRWGRHSELRGRRTYISRTLAGSAVPFVTDKNVRWEGI